MAGKSILIVEDAEETAELVKMALESENYLVQIAGSGEEVIEKVEKTKFDLILLDIMLPRVDGFEVARRLKTNRNTQPIPIFAMTALDIPGVAYKCLEVGMEDVIMKPFDLSELIAKVKKRLGEAGS
jgi:CheY-like chemotaxis protein